MPIPKINLLTQINKWKAARFGREVRQANVEAFEQIEDVVNAAIQQCYNDATGNPESIAAHVSDTSNPHDTDASKLPIIDTHGTLGEKNASVMCQTLIDAIANKVMNQIATSLTDLDAVDTSGVLGTAGAEVSAQNLIDSIADKVMTKILMKSQVINNFLANTEGTVADGRTVAALKGMIGDTSQLTEGDTDVVAALLRLNSSIDALNTKLTNSVGSRKVVSSITEVSLDANGYGQIPFGCTFSNKWVNVIISNESNNYFNVIETTISNFAINVFDKNGVKLANTKLWITWIAQGSFN